MRGLRAVIIAGVIAAPAAADPAAFRLREEAGPHARVASPVTLVTALPARLSHAAALAATLEDDSGRPTAIAVDAFASDGLLELYWVEPTLAAGSSTVRRVIVSAAETPQPPNPTGFRFVAGQTWRELTFADQPVWRRMYAYDPARHEATYKPYLHLYGFHDEGFITKADGGLYTSQRGVSVGWMQVKTDAKAYDFWHGNGVSQRQTGFDARKERTGTVVGRDCAITEWSVADRPPIVRDTRDFTAWHTRNGELVIDMTLTIEALKGPVSLATDPLHGSLVFRASGDVQSHAAETLVWHSAGGRALPNDVWSQAQWACVVIRPKEVTYALTAMGREGSPAGTVFATRDFGKLSVCFNATIKPGTPLTVSYRWLLQDLSVLPQKPADIELRYQDFANPVTVTFE